jgi:hypothetical protein
MNPFETPLVVFVILLVSYRMYIVQCTYSRTYTVDRGVFKQISCVFVLKLVRVLYSNSIFLY